MNIVHVVRSATFAGVERHVVTTAAAQAARGHSVTVIGGPQFAGSLDGTAVTFVEAATWARLLAALVRCRRTADVVHAHMTAAELAACITRPAVRARVVATRHFAARRGSSPAARAIAPLVRRVIDRQVSISRFVAAAIAEPSTVVPNAVPDTAPVDPVAPVVLMTQRLDEEKRTDEGLLAWERSGLADDGWQLVLAGDGHERRDLEELVARRGIRNVTFLGRVDDVDGWRRRAGMLLATAPAEPFGLAVAEAMAAGLPVVASGAGGHLETVGAARPDLLYPPGDVDAAAALLRRLAGDVEARRQAGGDLRTFQQAHLGVERHVDELDRVYREVTGRHAPGAPLRVLRVFHAAVVTSWRERDRQLRDQGCDVRLVSAGSWNEGGRDVTLTPEGDDFVVPARTWGRHPYVFVYDPRPIVRELRRRRFDLIDVHEEPASLAALELRVLRRLFGHNSPIVFYGAQNIEKRYPIPFRWIERGSLRVAAGAHCCNEDAARIFRRKGLRGVAAVIGLGVDLERFTPAPFHSSPPLRLGFVGRIEQRKGVHLLPAAIASLPQVRLDVWGDGPDRDQLEAAIADAGLQDRVTLHGFATDDLMPDVYRRFDALAVPSLRTPDWVEQFGRVAVEAMASGVPVLVSDDGALPEVVGDAGVLVPPGDVEAWRDAIAALAADAAERERLRGAGIERAKRYSWAAIAAAHRAFYDEVVA